MSGAHRAWVFGLSLIVSGCADKGMSPGGADALRPIPATAPVVASPNEAITPPTQTRPQVEIFTGTGEILGPVRQRSGISGTHAKGDITLNFINTDIRDVAKAVLGDYLKLNYEIGGAVQGTVTLQTSQPLARDQVLPVLEQVLRLNKFALVNSNGVYRVVSIEEAPHESGAIRASSRSGTPGYGIEVVPIRYIGAADMQKLLEPLAPAQGIVHVDTARNVLIIEGTAEERRTVLDDVALFDTDWLSGMSFALLSPHYMDSDELIKELNDVIGGLNSPAASIMRFVPIDRLNMVLAVTPQPRYLEQLKVWVARLDRPGEGTEKTIYVYHVQNGRASDLASTLGSVLFGGTRAPSSEHATAQPSSADQAAVTAVGTQTTPVGGSALPVQSATPAQTASATGGTKSGIRGFESVSLTADEVNNALVIAATPKQYTSILQALQRLDTAPVQVFLEAAIAEVTLTNDTKFGLQYSFQPNSQNSIILSNTASAVIGSAFPGFSYAFSNGSNINVILNALSTESHVEVVSSPKLLVLNNQTASLQVGDQVPIATEQATSVLTSNTEVVNSIQYQPTGVILKVTPRVNRGGIVMMDISQEVSEVSTTTTSTLNSPTISQRKIASAVAVQDGETIALGGLILNGVNRSRSGIPYLQDIPVLGNLFRTTTDNSNRTELIVLITPHVVDTVQKARTITDELRHKLPLLQPLLESPR